MRRVRQALGALGTNPAALHRVFQAACEDIVEAVDVDRVGVWFFDPAGETLTCECVFDRRAASFSAGEVLRAHDVPAYFEAVRRNVSVRAVDALNDPATREVGRSYFPAHGIRSMLDHVVFAGTRPVATMCAEACGAIREWAEEDAAYLSQMAILLGIAIEERRRREQPVTAPSAGHSMPSAAL